MADKRLIKEYKQLSKEAEASPNPQILQLEPVSENIFEWHATIAKPGEEDSEYYYHGQWDLVIKVPSSYPMAPPAISFSTKTPIAHPNIDLKTGEICLDILKSESWSPAWNINYLVVAILMLVDDPEPDSPLNIDMANLYRHDKVAYKSMCQYTIWKYGTFVKAGEELRDKSGIKVVEGVTLADAEVAGRESSGSAAAAATTTDASSSTAEDVSDDKSTQHESERISELVSTTMHQIESEARALAPTSDEAAAATSSSAKVSAAAAAAASAAATATAAAAAASPTLTAPAAPALTQAPAFKSPSPAPSGASSTFQFTMPRSPATHDIPITLTSVSPSPAPATLDPYAGAAPVAPIEPVATPAATPVAAPLAKAPKSAAISTHSESPQAPTPPQKDPEDFIRHVDEQIEEIRRRQEASTAARSAPLPPLPTDTAASPRISTDSTTEYSESTLASSSATGSTSSSSLQKLKKSMSIKGKGSRIKPPKAADSEGDDTKKRFSKLRSSLKSSNKHTDQPAE